MQRRITTETRSGLLFCLFILGMVTVLTILPYQFRSSAGNKKADQGLFSKTVSHEDGIEYYDIREHAKEDEAIRALDTFRQRSGTTAVAIADVKDGFARGEDSLRERVPTLKVVYNSDLQVPESIAPDAYGKRAFLTAATSPAGTKHADHLIRFLKENNSLIGASQEQINSLKVFADYTNPDGNLSFVELEQEINGIPVFRGSIKAGFTRNGEIYSVNNNFAPGLDYASLGRNFNDPVAAVRAAATNAGADAEKMDLRVNGPASTDLKVVFGTGDSATTAEKMYFPIEPGVARAAWRVLIYKAVAAYYVVVDAETGTMLWRKNIVNDQTQPATYNVYANSTSMLKALDSPAPITPGPIDPSLGTQGTQVGRTNVTLIGNEAPNTFNQLGWITDGTNGTNGHTDGNAVEAGLDIVAPDGIDAPQAGTGRVFSFAYNPPPGMPAPPDPIIGAASRSGAVTQLFYLCNRFHDVMYELGFTEAARNFQTTNFTAMGVGNDRVRCEAQDSSGTNNANMLTPADGGRGRMQMFRFLNTPDNRDGTIDGDVVVHEFTHGLSNRLIGNSTGLGNNRGGGMGEGWSDFYGTALLSEPTDPINGIYTTGAYVTFNVFGLGTRNSYYGIRRLPYAPLAFTGGPMNRPHNPLTAGDVNTGCSIADAAFPATAGTCNQIHNTGEIWASMLGEGRARYMARLGQAVGNRRFLQAVTDGMKTTPSSPNFVSARNEIILAAQASSAAPEAAIDAADVREGFRLRGLGFSATDNGTAVVEAFDAPTVGAGTATVTSGNNLLEPNECNTLNFSLNNNSGDNATGISAVLSSNTPGITVTQPNSAYPNIPGGGQNVANTTPYQVSVDNTVACYTSASFTITITYTGGGGGSPIVANFSLPIGIAGNDYTFANGMGATIPAGGTLVAGSQLDDAAVTVPMPAGWTSSVYSVPVTSLSASTNGMLTVNGAAATTFTNTALRAAVGGANPTLFPNWDDQIMTPVATPNGGIYANTTGTAPNRKLYIEWRSVHFAEPDGVPVNLNYAIELTEGSSTFRYLYVLTGIAPNANGVSATIGVQAGATAPASFTQFSFNTASTSPGFTLTATLPAGQCTPGTGPCGGVVPRSRADFDGDGKTDLSVFRPSEGNWYLQRSTAGFSVIKWGLPTDTLVPGDYDGDGKADTAVYRVSATPGTPDFFILNSNGFTVRGAEWGTTGDIPVTGDYNGDGRTDVTVFRPSNGVWYVLNSVSGTNTIAPFGQAGDIPMAVDMDGDGRTNFAIYRPSSLSCFVARPTGTPATNFDVIPFGVAGDILAPADYDNDNRDDLAVFRPSTGTWIIRRSTNGVTQFRPFGTSGDVPVPGDYDGDGADDLAVYRAGTWHILRSSTSIPQQQNFGVASDVPIPARYLPPTGGGGGGGGAATISYTGPAVAITDNVPAGVNINIPVTGAGTVSDLNFRFDTDAMGVCDGTIGDVDCSINHTWVGDLIIKITPPDGSPTVTIFDRPGVPASGAGCSNNNIGNILLNDEGGFPNVDLQGNPTPGACNTALLFPTGNFSPFSPLSALDGENSEGTWVINISDNAGADTGSVRRFSLIFNSGD